MSILSPNAARYNLRDYGGYTVASGARLRTGVLLRSGELDHALPEDRGLLARLGVATVIDLRSANEIATGALPAYDGFAGSVQVADCEDGIIPHAIEGLLRLTAPGQVAGKMIATYRLLPHSQRFRQGFALFLAALGAGEAASLIHCFAGKDRTGLAVALFQTIAGVHHDDVMEEYLLTNHAGEERIEAALTVLKRNATFAVHDDVLREAMAVRPEYLTAALAVISAENGNPAAWVDQAAGFDLLRQDQVVCRYLA